jgi:hypothetical protein
LQELMESGRKPSRHQLRMLMTRRGEPHIFSMLRLFDETFGLKGESARGKSRNPSKGDDALNPGNPSPMKHKV